MKSEKKGGGQPRSSFSGRLGYVLAVAGSAVGLVISGVFPIWLQIRRRHFLVGLF